MYVKIAVGCRRGIRAVGTGHGPNHVYMFTLFLVLVLLMQSWGYRLGLRRGRAQAQFTSPVSVPSRGVNLGKSRVLARARKTVDLVDYDGVRRKVAYVELGKGSNPGKEMILLGGCAQTAESFSSHFPSMERSMADWRVIIPEFRCQKNTDLLTKNATMETLCSDLESLIHELGLERPHLAGFSFGGRVALAFAASRPHLVGDKLSLTGVSCGRGGLGELIIEGWRDSLRKGDMNGTAWSFVINGYSREYLEKHSVDWLKTHVTGIAQSADSEKLLDLISYSHEDDTVDTTFSVRQSASRLTNKQVQIIAAEEDRIASAQGSVRLYEQLQQRNDCTYVEMEGGHLVPFENPRDWRTHIVNFLKEKVSD